MRTRHSLASFLLVLVRHFEKTIINCFFSFTFSVITLRRTQVRLSGEERKIRSSRNIVEMRTRHSLASFLLVSVKHFEKTIINCFFSFTLNLTSLFAKNIRIETKDLGFCDKTEVFSLFEIKKRLRVSILDKTDFSFSA